MTTVWKPRSVRYELSMNGKLTSQWLTRYGSQNLVDMLGSIPSTAATIYIPSDNTSHYYFDLICCFFVYFRSCDVLIILHCAPN